MAEIIIEVPDGELCEGCKYNMYHGPDRKCRLFFQDREMKECFKGAWYHVKCPACLKAIEEAKKRIGG